MSGKGELQEMGFTTMVQWGEGVGLKLQILESSWVTDLLV